MECLFKALIAIVAVAMLLIGAAWLFLKHQTPTAKTATIQPAAPATAPANAAGEDPGGEAIVLTLQSHSGVSALMTAQTLDGRDIPTQDASADEGQFKVACCQPEGVGDPDGSPQIIKICKPSSFVLHITGNGKGVFDLQARAFPGRRSSGRPVTSAVTCWTATELTTGS